MARVIWLLVGVVLVVPSCAGSQSARSRSFASSAERLAISFPSDWRLSTRNDGYVPDPALCLDLKPSGSAGVDLRLVEYLPPYFNPRDLHRYQPQPGRFRLTAFRKGDEDWSAGTVTSFRASGRVFFVGAVVPSGAPSRIRAQIESILDSLRIGPGGRCRPSSGVGSHGVPSPTRRIASRPRSTPTAPRMERTAGYILGYCHRSKRLSLGCPHLLPRMQQPAPHWEVNICLPHTRGCQGITWDDLSLLDADNGNRPPIWSHIVIYAGNLSHAFPFTYPTHGAPPRQLNGLFARPRSRPIFLGAYTWGGRNGTVILAPGYPTGGDQGDHLIFRWHQAGNDYAVGLHGWEPLQQVLAMLHRMILSI